jgi:3-hydroxybutyryl-CoA dehydrogenase
MGVGIAEVVARSGYSVTAVDLSAERASAAVERLSSSTERAVERGKLDPAERQSLLEAISVGTDLSALKACDVIIEAIPETLSAKQELIRDLDSIISPNAIIATNTSSLSVTEIAVASQRPARVIGLHFFNPAPVLGFVEIVRTVMTTDELVEAVTGFAQSLGKEPVVVGDRAGFIANALLFGYLNHAVSMYEQRYASREDIDAAMRLGCGYPMGPLALLDLIGLDTAYQILDTMYKQGRDRLHAPSPMLKHLVSAGRLGRKSGAGFYHYAEPGSPEVIDAAAEGARPEALHAAVGLGTIGVIGTGTMAAGIAEACARSGFAVVLVGRTRERADQAISSIQKSLGRSVEKGRLSQEESDAIAQRVTASVDYADVADADVVIEAVAEDIEVKQMVFAELDRVCKTDAVLATTTSSLPVIDIAMATKRPHRVVGIHFFNPAVVMKLVEVVSTIAVDSEAVLIAEGLCHRLGKHPVRCTDRAGFIVNALLFPYLNDAIHMAEANYATIDDIDIAMKKGCGYPMGPFELLDVVGLDVSLAIEQTLYREYREPGFAPAPRLEHLVTAGFLGRKTGRGFRGYS